MSDTKKNAGQVMLDFLKAKGKKARKAGTATTEELAVAAGISIKHAYDRLWWMEKKDGTLQSIGTGKARVWRTTKKVRQAGTSEAVETTEVPETAEAPLIET
jgi:hypothetical protein